MPRKPKPSQSEAPLAPVPSEILDQFVRQGPISHEELAGWTGSSREAVAKALATLRDLDLIRTERRRITVLDAAGLMRQSA